MASPLNIIAGFLFVIWIVEYFGYDAGEDIHLLLLLSIILFLIKTFILLPGKEPDSFKKINNQ